MKPFAEELVSKVPNEQRTRNVLNNIKKSKNFRGARKNCF